jgi:small-conductance mechanosensitive channel
MSICVLGFESVLETGGVLGIIGVFLALTQGSWAPDLIGGLIVLNSGLIEEGDVIELPGKNLLGVVFKTKMFHTEFLSLSNNHRIMIANAQLRQESIHNLSKFASAKGLRESLSFKIGYDTPTSYIHQLFQTSFEEVVADSTLSVQGQYPLEIRVDDAGDYAVKWTLFYYIKDLKKMLAIRQGFCKKVVLNSPKFNVSLATPILHQNVDHQESIVLPLSTPNPQSTSLS